MLSRIMKLLILTISSLILFPMSASGFEIPGTIRVGLESKYAGVDTVVILNKEISLSTGSESRSVSATTGFSVRGSDGKAVLYDGSAIVAVLNSGDGIAGVGVPINLGERRYRGMIEFMVIGSRVTAVNCLTIEEYLYSVVPSEMPQSWHIEALKAQAVAARSYSMTRLSAHGTFGYNFCDLGHCQNYLGAGNEAENTTTAVNATAGILAYYDGAPINAVYSSSNGGYSSASEHVWMEAVPYLRAVEDVNERSGSRWERRFSFAQIQALLGEDIGPLTRVYIGKTAPSGRVLELTIEGARGSKTLTKDSIRTFFSGADGGMLESTNFVIQGASQSAAAMFVSGVDGIAQIPIVDMYILSAGAEAVHMPPKVTIVGKDSSAVYETDAGGVSASDSVVFIGRGRGHGVGMSQFGAKDLAEAGLNYVQILKYYYTGIEVG